MIFVKILAALAFALICGVLGAVILFRYQTVPAATYAFEIEVVVPDIAADPSHGLERLIRVPLPLSLAAAQRVASFTASQPLRARKDTGLESVADVVVSWTSEEVAPVSVLVNVAMYNQPNPEPRGDLTPHLIRGVAEGYNHHRSIENAGKLRRSTLLESARAVQDAAVVALAQASGELDDRAVSLLAVSLLRSIEIPARRVAGVVVEADGAELSAHPRVWTEFFDGSVWRLLDPAANCFDDQYRRYVAFRRIGDLADRIPNGWNALAGEAATIGALSVKIRVVE